MFSEPLAPTVLDLRTYLLCGNDLHDNFAQSFCCKYTTCFVPYKYIFKIHTNIGLFKFSTLQFSCNIFIKYVLTIHFYFNGIYSLHCFGNQNDSLNLLMMLFDDFYFCLNFICFQTHLIETVKIDITSRMNCNYLHGLSHPKCESSGKLSR